MTTARLVEWAFAPLPDGFAMTHPEGADVATIHYRECLQPLRSVGTLITEALRGWPDFVVELAGPIERLTTYDGAHAVALTVGGTEHGASVQRDLGFVLFDELVASVAGTCRREDQRADVAYLVRDLLRNDSHGLGTRRRRFEYDPPRDWQPLPQGLSVEWLAPDYPRSGTSIIAYPANPRVLAPAFSLDAIAADLARLGYVRTPLDVPHAVANAHGLTGRLQAFARATRDSLRLRAYVVLADERYHYTLELASADTARWAQSCEQLCALVDSVRPIR